MKRFLTGTLVFLLPIIAGAYILDYLLNSSLRKSRKGEFAVWNDIYDSKIDADIFIYGSSRAWVHIDPAIIKDSLNLTAYNFGIDGHNFWLQDMRHKVILKYNRKPKMIIHSLDVFTLMKRKGLYAKFQFFPYMRNDKLMKEAISSYDGFKYGDYIFPMMRFYGEQKSLLHAIELLVRPQANVPERIDGYKANDLPWSNDLAKAKEDIDDYIVSLDTPTMHKFDAYLAECKANNIRVVFVYTPEYIEGQNFVANRKEILAAFKTYSEKHQVPFLDYSNDSLSYNTAYFYNSEHLNKRGATLFTRQLVKDLKNIHPELASLSTQAKK